MLNHNSQWIVLSFLKMEIWLYFTLNLVLEKDQIILATCLDV